MPQSPFIIATKAPSADVLVFDYTKHPSRPGKLYIHTCNLLCKPPWALTWYCIHMSMHKRGQIVQMNADLNQDSKVILKKGEHFPHNTDTPITT